MDSDQLNALADHDLARRVYSFLTDRLRPSTRNLQVESRQGVITLSGHVCSFYEKQLLQEASQRVAGVIGIRNVLDVALHSSRPASSTSGTRRRGGKARRLSRKVGAIAHSMRGDDWN